MINLNAISEFCDTSPSLENGCMFFCDLALTKHNHMVCFRRKAVLKSDTAVALRRILSVFVCLTLVSFINVYDEYFCNLMWLSALSPNVCLRQCIYEHNAPISNEVFGHKDELY